MFSKLLTWIKDRLSESSTLTWIVATAAYFGWVIDPSLLDYIATAAVSLIAIIQFSKKDASTILKKQEKESEKTDKTDLE